MRFTPRKEEYAGVVEILESGEYDDATHMSKALVNAIADMLWMRDWFVVCHRESPIFNADYGPFASEAEATTFCTKGLGGLGGTARVVKILSPGMTVAKRDGAMGWKGFCLNCGHTKHDHLTDGQTRGKCARALAHECECTKWREKK